LRAGVDIFCAFTPAALCYKVPLTVARGNCLEGNQRVGRRNGAATIQATSREAGKLQSAANVVGNALRTGVRQFVCVTRSSTDALSIQRWCLLLRPPAAPPLARSKRRPQRTRQLRIGRIGAQG